MPPLAFSIRPLLAAVLVGCASATGPADTLQLSWAERKCGPTGGLAFAVTLANTPVGAAASQGNARALEVSVWQPLDGASGRTYRVSDDNAPAIGFYLAGGGPRHGSVTGTIRIEAIRADTTVAGSVDVRLPDGSRLQREFEAPWRSREIICR